MKELFKNLTVHWKTSVAGLLMSFLTYMLWSKAITVTEWAEGLGVVATVIGLLAKDWDKTDQ